MTSYKIGVIPGDGIGQEVTAHAKAVLSTVGVRFGVSFEFRDGMAGGTAYDVLGDPFPAETERLCTESDAILFGAVGGPKWDALPREKRPEAAILGLRKKFNLFANLRPAIMFDPLVEASTLKAEAVRGLDLLVVREGVGGIYFGSPRMTEQVGPGEERALDTLVYTSSEIRRIMRVGMEMASVRGKKLLSVDKENVLESSRLWRKIAKEVAGEFPDVDVSHMYVDAAAMELIRDPLQFDVIVTGNMFGDILSDAASMLTGSIGMLASANLNEEGFGVFEPVHGTAPDIAGQDKANPIAAVMSAAMLCRYALKRVDMADVIEASVSEVLGAGLRTSDIHTPGTTLVGCAEMGGRLMDMVGD